MVKKHADDAANTGVKEATHNKGQLASVAWNNPQPNSDDRAWLQDNEDGLVELCIALLDEIPDDGRLSIKLDGKSSRWLAILFVPSGGTGSELDALSVRGASSLDALCLLAYFHLVRFKGEWANIPDNDLGKWG